MPQKKKGKQVEKRKKGGRGVVLYGEGCARLNQSKKWHFYSNRKKNTGVSSWGKERLKVRQKRRLENQCTPSIAFRTAKSVKVARTKVFGGGNCVPDELARGKKTRNQQSAPNAGGITQERYAFHRRRLHWDAETG